MSPFVTLPPPELDPEGHENRNRMFYTAEPHDYFGSRLELLTVYAAKPEAILRPFQTEVEYKGLKVGPVAAGRRPFTKEEAERDERNHDAFIVAESVALLHHASETLLRYYLAHASMPPCPWIEIAQETFSTFPPKVTQRFDGSPLTQERRAELAKVFYVTERPPPESGLGDQEWDDSLRDLEKWLNHFAHWWLQPRVYNSVKHGFTVQAGMSEMRLMTPADADAGRDPPLIHADGPSIAFLELKGNPRLWHHTTAWVQPERLMGETMIASLMLRRIWRAGRMRYLAESGQVEFHRPTYDAYMATRGDPTGGDQVLINTMSWNLSYLHYYEPDLVCSSCGRTPGPEEHDARIAWRAWSAGPDTWLQPWCPRCVSRFPNGPDDEDHH